MDVILDVDPGVDDALAILLALASPELNLLGLTVTSGNVPLENGVENALRVLAFAGREDVPVYRGADRPLARPAVYAKQVHGSTGLGRASLPASSQGARDDATGFLVNTLAEREGVTVIAVGPLTNLATAERRAPGTLSRAERIVVMGGAVAEPGNASPVAEFNFFVDPEAVREVLAAGAKLTLVPLDVTHLVGIDDAEIEETLRQTHTPVARFFVDATEVVVANGRTTGGYAGVYLHDPAAVVLAVRPELFTVETFHADCETAGELTAGQLVTDRRLGLPDGKRKGRPVDVAMDVEAEKMLDLFRTRVLG